MDIADIPDVPEWLPDHLRADGIESLYPPQAEAVEAGVTGGENLVASIPTASGKTLIAQLAMFSSIAGEEGGTALYIVPLRALASEKHAEFEAFEQYGLDIGVSTGNYESDGGWLAGKDVVVATSEKVDSLVRNDAPWIDDLDCVVADEVHLVDDAERGPTLEVTLAKLRQRNPDLQTVALSATIGNADELADWLDAALVDSEWRPIELQKGVHYGQAMHLEDGSQRELRVRDREKPTAAVVRDTLEDDGSTLVFVNSRRNAEAAAGRLGSTVADHLPPEERDALAAVADEIREVSDTETSDDLADAVEQGAAFHHAGLCVTGDTQILRADGTFNSIRSLVDSGSDHAETVGLDDYEIDTTSVTDTFEMSERSTLTVETKTGNTLQLSYTHPLPTLGKTGIEWVNAADITEGEYIARPRQLDINPESPSFRDLIPAEHHVYRKYDTVSELVDRVPVSQIDMTYRENYKYDRNISVGDFRTLCDEAGTDPRRHLDEIICDGGHDPVTVPPELNDDLCWLIGAVAGDGYLRKHGVTLTGRSDLLGEFERIASEQFGHACQWGESPTGTSCVHLGSKLVADILERNFGIPRGKKSLTVQLPDIPLSNDDLAAYISGLFDTDGSVSPRKNSSGAPCVEFYSTSEKLINQLKTSLLRFGIRAYRDRRDTEGRVTETEGREIVTRNDVHRLTIYGTSQLTDFKEKIGFRHPEKAAKLDKAIETNPRGGRDQLDVIPPTIGETVREMRSDLGMSLSDLEPAVPKATLSRFERGKTPMKRSTFESLADALDVEKLRQIANSDIYWDRVESVSKSGPEPLFDLSTETNNFVANGIVAHNTSDHRELVEDAFRDRLVRVVCATPTLAAGVNTPSRRVVVRDWRRYDGAVGGMTPLSVLEVHQMMGRAGRPGLDPYGEAVLLANNHDELDELFERYVWADPEPVRSKLAAEPALRTHILATVASGFASSREGLLSFLERTLYAAQTDGRAELERVTDNVLEYLERNEFLTREVDGLTATSLGHTVSRLYLDPMSAAEVIDGLRAADDRPTALGLYHLVSRTPDMYELYLRSGEDEEYTMLAYERESEFLGAMPSEFEESRFESWLSALKTARLLEDWADEVDEDEITDRYQVGPGDIRGKVETAAWLLGAAESLAGELDGEWTTAVREARTRVEHGVREELVDLAGVRGVGRKRARRLYDAGIEDRAALRNAEKSVVLAALRGRRGTAENVLENVGHRDPSMDDVEPDPDAAPDDTDTGSEEPDTVEDQSSLGDF